MIFTVHSAKTQLSKLINAALEGEDVIIAKGKKPVVRLVPVAKDGFKFGILADKVKDSPDFFEPMDSDELDLWEGKEG